MKKNMLIGLFSATVLFTGSSYADYSFHLNNPDSCDSISGAWSGKGSASSWVLGRCDYHGKGIISAVDKDGHFSVQVTVEKDSGSSLCPSRVNKQFNAVCNKGVVIIKSKYGSLKGSFTSKTGNASGTLSVAPGLEADVIMQFVR